MGRLSRRGMLRTAATLIIAGGLAACGDSSDEVATASSSNRAGAPFALDFARTWPPLVEDQAVPVADDLTAANYYIVLDGSGSMEESKCSGGLTKMDAAKQAVARFAGQIPDDANIGLAVFDGIGLSERTPLRAGNRADFEKQVRSIIASGGTPLSEAVRLGYDALTIQGLRQLGYGEYHLVMITDGEASDGYEPGRMVDAVLTQSPVVIHTIGFCIGERHSLNQPGRIAYRAADDPAALERGLAAVLAESPDFTITDF